MKKSFSFKFPFYDVGAIVAGFYAGYAEGNGVDVSPAVECLTKYGPTAFIVAATPIMIKATNTLSKWAHKKMIVYIERGDLNVITMGGVEKLASDLGDDEKQKMLESMDRMKTNLDNQKYLKPTLMTGTKTAVETAAGYVAGRLYSRIG